MEHIEKVHPKNRLWFQATCFEQYAIIKLLHFFTPDINRGEKQQIVETTQLGI